MKQQPLFTAATALWAFAAVLSAAEPDTQLAALELAAGRGDPKAQTELAVKYEHAEGVPRDFQEANRLYCRAAKQGYADAQFKLGWVYANGRGVARDDGVSAILFKMAADQGHEYAAKLLPYVRTRADTQMPSCLLPDPPVVAALEPEAEDSRCPGRAQRNCAIGATARAAICSRLEVGIGGDLGRVIVQP